MSKQKAGALGKSGRFNLDTSLRTGDVTYVKSFCLVPIPYRACAMHRASRRAGGKQRYLSCDHAVQCSVHVIATWLYLC